MSRLYWLAGAVQHWVRAASCTNAPTDECCRQVAKAAASRAHAAHLGGASNPYHLAIESLGGQPRQPKKRQVAVCTHKAQQCVQAIGSARQQQGAEQRHCVLRSLLGLCHSKENQTHKMSMRCKCGRGVYERLGPWGRKGSTFEVADHLYFAAVASYAGSVCAARTKPYLFIHLHRLLPPGCQGHRARVPAPTALQYQARLPASGCLLASSQLANMSGQAIAVVTGGNRGIGLELCKQLMALGYHVYGACRKSSPELEDLGCDIITGVDVGRDDGCYALTGALGDKQVCGKHRCMATASFPAFHPHRPQYSPA